MQTGWYNPSHIPSRPLPRQNRPPTPNGSMRRALPGALALAFAPASSSSSLLRLRAAVASVRHLSRGRGGGPPRPTPPAVPPAYLAPTGSPHAYVARCAAAEAGIDPRSLLALGEKGTRFFICTYTCIGILYCNFSLSVRARVSVFAYAKLLRARSSNSTTYY